MARDLDPYRLSSPRIYLIRMLVFLGLALCVGAVLYKRLLEAFLANPALNGLILFSLFLGIAFAMRQVLRLMPEVRWVNAYRLRDPGLELRDQPVMLAPMAALLGEKVGRRTISPTTLRSILESIGLRLDEQRDISRYLTGLLVFLGLLGTFWGLIDTVGSVGRVINTLGGGGTAGVLFEDLKTGLAAPLAGMGISFSSSLFGLAGSLILGFLDLQAGQAQNRFYNELEDWLAATVTDIEAEASARHSAGEGDMAAIKTAIERLATVPTDGAAANRTATAAMAQLAEGIQGLVQHMRAEQQMIRDWVEAQADQQKDIKAVMQRLLRDREMQ